MKRYLFQQMLAAGIGLFMMPSAFAQTEKNPKSADAKEYQQIIINRKTPANEKTVIEINGDKVKINGKEVSTNKDEDITVRINKIRDLNALQGPMAPGFRGRNFNLNDDENSLLNKIKDLNALQDPMAPGFRGRNFDLNDDEKFLLNADSNRAMLGVLTEGNEKGALVKSVSGESAAEKAGLKTGDIITRINDKKITNAEEVAEEVRQHKPGDKITITFIREGKEQKATAELGRWKGVQLNTEWFRMDPELFKKMMPNMPNMPSDPFVFRDGMNNNAPKLGISVQDTEDGKGVKVLDVDKESHAAKSGVKANDIITHVNNEAVNSVDEIARKIRENKEKNSVTLKVLRNGKTQNIEVQIPRKLKTANL